MYAKTHPSVAKAAKRKWHEANRDAVKASKHRRRVLGRASAERFTAAEIYERDGWICGICKQPVDAEFKFPDNRSPSIDHILPIAMGGDHSYENVQLAHMGCNRKKGARDGTSGRRLD